jgi:hypothetical protein
LWDKTGTPVISVTLAANGRTAELTAVEPYRSTRAGDSEPVVQLMHTMIFEWVSGRWQYTLPGDDFWGAEQGVERPYVRLSYPAREAELGERLAGDLDALVARVCAELADIRCPPQYQLAVQLQTDPFLEQNLMFPTTPRAELHLPAPTVVGRPADEAAYAALLDGYAPLVVRGAVAQLTGWECCAGQVFFKVLLDDQLRTLGLPAGSPANPDFAHLVRKKVQPDDLFGLWNLGPERMQPEMLDRAQAVVGFLFTQQSDVSAAEWQRRLAVADNYLDWAGAVAALNMSPRLRAAWISYLYSHSGGDGNSPPETTGQDLLLLCSSAAEATDQEQLFRYSRENNRLQPELPGRHFTSARLFATLEHGILLVEGFLGNNLQMYTLREGTAQLIWENQNVDGRSWFEASPLGNYLYWGFYFPEPGTTAANILDVASCNQGDCTIQPLPADSAPPVWSPDEQHFLFVQDETLYLELLPVAGREVILDPPDEGYYDFSWLDNTTFAYSRIRETGGNETTHWSDPRQIALNDGQPTTLFDPIELQALLPIDEGAPNWVQIKPHPLDPQHLFVVYEFWDARTFYIFELERGSGVARLLLTAEDTDSSSLTLSPDGRWITFSREREIVIYDTAANHTQVIANLPGILRPEWSSDSQWFFALSENFLLLVNPTRDDSHLHVEPQATCSQAVWVPGP